MRPLLWIAAVGTFLGAAVLWNLAIIAILRSFSLKIPFSVAFRFSPRRGRELFAALEGSSEDRYVFVSGFLLLTCPLSAGLISYDYVVHQYIEHSTFGLNYFVGSAVFFVILAIVGLRSGVADWRKSAKKATSSVS